MMLQVQMFENGKTTQAKRLKERTEFDLEMMREWDTAAVSKTIPRYFDRLQTGDRPSASLTISRTTISHH